MTFIWVRLYWHQNLLLEHTLKPLENPSPILSVCWGKVVFKVSRNFSIALWDLWAGPKGGPFLLHSLKNTNNSFWSKHEMCAAYRNTLYVMWKAELCPVSGYKLQKCSVFLCTPERALPLLPHFADSLCSEHIQWYQLKAYRLLINEAACEDLCCKAPSALRWLFQPPCSPARFSFIKTPSCVCWDGFRICNTAQNSSDK